MFIATKSLLALFQTCTPRNTRLNIKGQMSGTYRNCVYQRHTNDSVVIVPAEGGEEVELMFGELERVAEV